MAGPNGAGKTTFFELFIAPSGLPFVNADFIAKELAEKGKPIADYEAARLAEQKRQEYVSEKRSFCMETVFSDAAGSKRMFFKDAQAKGFAVLLVFIGLNHVETSRSRVAQRVSAGGHNVPDRKIDSRFPRTFDNLQKAIHFGRSRLSVRQQFLRRTVSADRDVRGRRTPRTVSAAPALGAFHTA